jgi:hypothetical protein
VTRTAQWLVACVCLILALTACGGRAKGQAAGNTLIILDRSIGGVVLREKRVEVERRLGRGLVLHAADQQPPEPRLHVESVLYTKVGLEVSYVSRDDTLLSRSNGRVAVVVTRSPRYHTPQGVHVGSPAAAVQSIQGIECGDELDLLCQHGGHVHNQPGTSFQLDQPDGNVVTVAIAYSD